MKRAGAFWPILALALTVAGSLAPAIPAAHAQAPPETLRTIENVAPIGGAAGSATAPGPRAGAGSPHELLVKGNALYEEGHFEEAVRAYETAASYGVENEVLQFNLGNAYFRLGRLGPAILAYERAHRLAPGDPDIRANLEFARAHATDVPPAREEGPIAIVRGWLLRPSINGSAAAALIAYLVGAALFGLVLIGKQRRPMLLALGIVAWLLAVPPALVVATQGSMREMDRHAVVMAERVECRSGPGDSNPVLFAVHEGTTVEIVDAREGWSRITLPDGLNGWLPTPEIERVRQ